MFAGIWDLPHQTWRMDFGGCGAQINRTFVPRLVYRSFCRQNRRTQSYLISEHRYDAHLAKDPTALIE